MRVMSSFHCSSCNLNRLLISDLNMEDAEMLLQVYISNAVYLFVLSFACLMLLSSIVIRECNLLRCGESLININMFLSSLSIE